jgi:large subunit ribosomal protein L24
MKIKKEDSVIVITGKDKGKKGKVVKSFPKDGMIVVEGVNMRKKHQRARRQNSKGQVVEIASPINASNVKLAK